MTEIGSGAFDGCMSLISVTIPEDATEIGREAFENCTSLASVIIPERVWVIDAAAFAGCSSLAEFRYGGTKEQWKAVVKGFAWHADIPAKSVICSDGEVPLDDEEPL